MNCNRHRFVLCITVLLLISGCALPQIRLFEDGHDPLKEYTLQGDADEKILLVSIQGNITDMPKKGWYGSRPSMVQEIVSQLRKAETDPDIKALLLKVNSPGGTVTASDILYHEISRFKEKTDCKLVSVIMDVGASGAYYISLPADRIVAHPTSITGSVGVIFLRPKLTGLMGKIGIDVEVDKSGVNKDMGSPFRPTTEPEKLMLRELTLQMGKRFVDLVARHRGISGPALEDIATARIFLAEEAKTLGLVDRIGYLDTAVEEAQKAAGLPENARLVVYRRTKYFDDNVYNTAIARSENPSGPVIDLGLADAMASMKTGFYYLWWPAAGQ